MNQEYYYGTGRRKTAVARVRLFEGNGTIIVNGKPLQENFGQVSLQNQVMEPLLATNSAARFNAMIKVDGGGVAGQAGAIRHGISRALAKADESLRPLLRKQNFLTRDSRMKERKKYGLKRARKAPQYTKR